MYLHRDQADELLQGHLQGLLSSLQGHQSFLNQLLDGDDWSFVIKAQALVEGFVTQAVLAHISEKGNAALCHARFSASARTVLMCE